jgi:hypothetical protein
MRFSKNRKRFATHTPPRVSGYFLTVRGSRPKSLATWLASRASPSFFWRLSRLIVKMVRGAVLNSYMRNIRTCLFFVNIIFQICLAVLKKTGVGAEEAGLS